MKRYIKSAEVSNIIKELVGHIDLVIIANDARTMTLGNLPIVAAKGMYTKNYDDFSKEELIDLDISELRQIQSPYAIDLINDAVRENLLEYRLTNKQKDILSEFYSKRSNALIDLNDGEVKELIELISQCKSITGPYPRLGQPENNFAAMHGFGMASDDYLNIVKSITPDEFHGAVKSMKKDRLGVPLYEFIHDPKNYKLEYKNQVISSDILIYIKLIINYEGNYNISIISFHDPYPETLADVNED